MVVTTEVSVKDELTNKQKIDSIVNSERLISSICSDIYDCLEIDETDSTVTIDFRNTARKLLEKGWTRPVVEVPQIVTVHNTVYIMCQCCNHKVKEYSLDPFFPDCNEVKNAVKLMPQTLYPNYCENCGAILK